MINALHAEYETSLACRVSNKLGLPSVKQAWLAEYETNLACRVPNKLGLQSMKPAWLA